MPDFNTPSTSFNDRRYEASMGSSGASFKVSISCLGKTVIFEASTPVSEQRNANYDRHNIVHLPTDLLAYRNTGSRKFGVVGKIISRNAQEAKDNAGYLSLIRSWCLPDFGSTGAAPPIVHLSAYSNQNIKNLACVITSYSWIFPDDIDYIFANTPEPMPIITQLTVELEEIYSAEEITAGRWMMKDANGNQLGVSRSIVDTGNISTLASTPAFDGLATLGGASAAKLFNQAFSIAKNPLNTAVAEVANSTSIVESTKSTIQNNPFINGSNLLPGESGGVPTIPQTVNSSTDKSFSKDPFNRTSFSLPNFISF